MIRAHSVFQTADLTEVILRCRAAISASTTLTEVFHKTGTKTGWGVLGRKRALGHAVSPTRVGSDAERAAERDYEGVVKANG